MNTDRPQDIHRGRRRDHLLDLRCPCEVLFCAVGGASVVGLSRWQDDLGLYEAMRTTRAVRRLRPDPVPDDGAAAGDRGGDLGAVGRQSPAVAGDRGARRGDQAAAARAVRGPWERRTRAASGAGSSGCRRRGARARRAGAARRRPSWPRTCTRRRSSWSFCFHPELLMITDAGLTRPSVVGGASVYPAVQNLLLACRAEGLGCVLTTLLCMAEARDPPAARHPEPWATAAFVPIGYPLGQRPRAACRANRSRRWPSPTAGARRCSERAGDRSLTTGFDGGRRCRRRLWQCATQPPIQQAPSGAAPPRARTERANCRARHPGDCHRCGAVDRNGAWASAGRVAPRRCWWRPRCCGRRCRLRPGACPGDCDGDDAVGVNELIAGVACRSAGADARAARGGRATVTAASPSTSSIAAVAAALTAVRSSGGVHRRARLEGGAGADPADRAARRHDLRRRVDERIADCGRSPAARGAGFRGCTWRGGAAGDGPVALFDADPERRRQSVSGRPPGRGRGVTHSRPRRAARRCADTPALARRAQSCAPPPTRSARPALFSTTAPIRIAAVGAGRSRHGRRPTACTSSPAATARWTSTRC